MEAWLTIIGFFLVFYIFSSITDWLKERKEIASIPQLEQDVLNLKETNRELLKIDEQIESNVIGYREKHESDRKRKIYFANRTKKRFRRY